MTNRELSYIVRDQKPLVFEENETVGNACRAMRSRGVGSVLVVDDKNCLTGIFTGRDAVRLITKVGNAGDVPLAKAMTRAPVVVNPTSRAIDALRAMADAECRHIPVVHEGTIHGVVSRRDFKGMELEEFMRQHSGMATGGAQPQRLGGDPADQTAHPLVIQDHSRGVPLDAQAQVRVCACRRSAGSIGRDIYGTRRRAHHC